MVVKKNSAEGKNIAELKKAEETLQNRVQELTSLNTLSQLISTNLSLDQMAKTALEGITETITSDLSMLFLREGDKLLLLGYNARNPQFQHEETPGHVVGECMCGLAVSEGKPIYSSNIHNDPRCTWDECKKAGLVSLAALPLFGGGEIIGVLCVASGTERDFEKQAAFLETLSSEIAICLQNALLYKEVERHSAGLNRANEELMIKIAELKKAEEETQKRIKELEDFYKMAVGRELKMIESEKEVEKLKKEIEKLRGYNK